MTRTQGKITAAGDLDPSFGNLGVVTLAVPNATYTQLNSIFPAQGGQFYVAGTAIIANQSHFWIARLSANGALETPFGSRGFVTGHFGHDDQNPISSFGEHVSIINRAGTDYLLLCGRAYSGNGPNALARFDLTGALDPTFGDKGKAIIHLNLAAQGSDDVISQAFAGESYTQSTYTQDEGKVLITQVLASDNMPLPPTRRVSLIIRLDQDGQLDKTFDTKGYVIVSAPGYYDADTSLHSLMRHNDQYIGVGYVERRGYTKGLLVSYNLNGTINNTFNFGGYVTFDLPGPAVTRPTLYKVAGQSADRILGVGGTTFSNDMGLIVSYEANGTPNLQFNNGAPLSTKPNEGETCFYAGLAQARDNKIVVAGFWENPESEELYDRDWIVMRFEANGAADLTFNEKGWKDIRLGDGEDYPFAIVEQGADNKLVIAGTSGPVGKRVGNVVRLQG